MTSEGESRIYIWDHADRLVGFRQAPVRPVRSPQDISTADGLRVKKWVRRGGTPALDESTVYLAKPRRAPPLGGAGGGENTLLHVLDGTNRIALVRLGPVRPRFQPECHV